MNNDFMNDLNAQLKQQIAQLKADYEAEWQKYQAGKSEFTPAELHLMITIQDASIRQLLSVIESM